MRTTRRTRRARAIVRWLRIQELGPGRILAYLFGFALAGYAAWRLVPPNPIGVVAWFAAVIVAHDLVLLPLYGSTHHGMLAVFRRRGWLRWFVHLRVPAMMSGIMLLVFFPLILDSSVHAQRWILLSIGLFAVSGLWLVCRLAYQRVRIRC